MKKTRTPPELVMAEWETVVAAEEALNESFLRTLMVRSNEGRVVACGREDSVARVIKELVPNRRPTEETEKRLVEAAERLRQMSGSAAYVLAMGDGFILTCGEANEVASILDADHELDVPMPTRQVYMRSQPQRLTI
jgi:NAD(P)H-flavin reductase